MAESAEHNFISLSLDKALLDFSDTKLLGVREAQRRTFDYGCILLRDLSRPLVSQVLWSHHEGIEKDLRTLVFDGGASLKLYFVRDNIRNRAKVDEIVRDYQSDPSIAKKLRGLRIVAIPDGFDADSESQRNWMESHLKKCMVDDLLFGVVFGKLTPSDVATFADHGGIVGLKFAALQKITSEGLWHGPTFEKELGTKGSPLREALTMLGASGLVQRIPRSILKVPSLKGRFLLDFTRKLMLEWERSSTWSDEMLLIFRHLKIEAPQVGSELERGTPSKNIVHQMIASARGAKSQFGIDILSGIDLVNPVFHSNFNWRAIADNTYLRIPGATDLGQMLWNDDDDIDILSLPKDEL